MAETALVTGGGGFLGRRIVELLLERGDTVQFLARGRYREVEALGARGYQLDLRTDDLADAVRGVDVVYHVASKADFRGSREEFVGINVDGTRNLVEACRKAGVGRLVYTSTPSVIGYQSDAAGIESAPYPSSWEGLYGETKAMAEQLVLTANSPTLRTVALRPHLVIGPRDTNLLPRVIERAKQGRLMIVGDGQNRVDLTYVDNAAWAHLDAADALRGEEPACAGKAYFVSNDEPVSLWEWTNAFLPRVGAPPATRKIGLGTAMFVGRLFELAYAWLPLRGEPRMTRFLAVGLGRTHWYSMAPAKRDFGYQVRVSMAEATDRTVAWFQEKAASP